MNGRVIGDLAGVVLCGGRSSRMGRSKADLDFGGEPLLARVVRTIGEVAAPIIVVAAPDQQLPTMPTEVTIVRDPVEGQGPLQGIAVGLAAAAPAAYAFVSSTDAPFLSPAFVARMLALAADHDIAIVRDDDHHHPLGAVYATKLHRDAEALLAENRRRPFFLLERADTRIVTRADLLADDALRAADPDLRALMNLNTPEDYAAALELVTA